MGRRHFMSDHHSVPPDYSLDAIIYVVVVVVFYAAIIILLLTTNFRRQRSQSNQHHQRQSESNQQNPRKHWLFFNPISGEAQQANKKESQHFIYRQDAETV